MNFNFGEHYYSDDGSFIANFILTVIGGFLGLGTALFIYHRQNMKDKYDALQKQQEELSDTLIYFKELLKGIVDIVDKHGKKAKEFSTVVMESPLEIQQLKMYASKEFERVHYMDSLKIFYAFRYKFSHETGWIEEFRKLYSSLDFIDGHLNEIVRMFENYRDMNYKRMLKFKDIVDGIPTYMANEMNEYEKSLADCKNDGRYRFLNDSILRFHEMIEDKPTPDEINERFLLPILKQSIEYYNFENFGTPIANKCKRARMLLTEVRNDSEDTAVSIGRSPELLAGSKSVLEKMIMKLS